MLFGFVVVAEKPQDRSTIADQIRVEATVAQGFAEGVEVVWKEEAQRSAVVLLSVNPVQTAVALRTLLLLSSRAGRPTYARDSVRTSR